MQTTRLKKKGFTLVELVVVIAVIAVLSAILIPSIGCIVEQAKETNDTATVRLLNAALVEDEANNGKPELFRDAIKVVAESGYNIEKLTPLSSGEILWDSVNNRFLLKNKEGNDIYRDNSTTAVDDVYLWKIVKVGESISGTYSNYLSAGYTLADGVDALKATTGVDVGENQNIGITYSGKETAQDVVFYTNGGTVKFSDTNDESHQKHYGSSDTAEIATGNNCYEGHALVGKMTITQGKAVAGSGAYIGIVTAKASDGNSIALQEDGGVFVISASANVAEIDADVVSDLGYTKSGDGEEATFEASTERAEKSVYQITDEESLIAFRDSYNNGSKISSAKLMNDITLTKKWTPIGGPKSGSDGIGFSGTFDGDNHTIYNLTIGDVGGDDRQGLFEMVTGTSTIKNVKLVGAYVKGSNSWNVGGLIGYISGENVTVENCSIDETSTIDANHRVGGLIGAIYNEKTGNSTYKLSNLTNKATVKAANNEAQVGGIVGQITEYIKESDGWTGTVTVTMTNCHNYGTVTGNSFQGFTGGVVGTIQQGTLTLDNCSNNVSLDSFTGYVKGDLIGWIAVNSKEKVTIKNCTFNGSAIGALTQNCAYKITVGDDVKEYTTSAATDTSTSNPHNVVKFSDYYTE